ncbi:polyprenol dehydrogenase-like isoform X2 [Crassostrea virginica]|uniref:Dehydrogenase/reductase SDR family member on chromosome X-like n=1 Tax=Crassostrea virginica TaxID=6565 RepID=A0A8B8CVR1_CRAVI|nr:dehydrogenase/reductase SDR family member on chromosome X-like [Crassostrea virginica]
MALPILGLLRYVWSAVKIYVLGFIALLRQIFQKHEVPELHLHTGKIAVVTGGTCGIGFHVSLGLVAKNVHVVMAGHDIQKGKEAITKIREIYPNAKVDYLHLDLASFTSIQNFVENIKARCSKIHILVNNAAIMLAPYKETEDDFESHFQVNYLGHLYLTQSLLGMLRASGTEEFYTRIINVSSIVHNIGSLDLQNFGKRCTHWLEYSPHAAYANSKLDIVLASWHLSEQLRREASPVTVNAVHPGVVNSSLYKHVHPAIKWLMDLLAKYTYKTPSEGADSILYLALSPSVERETGGYYDNCRKLKTCQLAYSDSVIEQMYILSTDMIQARVN